MLERQDGEDNSSESTGASEITEPRAPTAAVPGAADQQLGRVADEASSEDVGTEGTPLPAFWAAIKRMPRYARLSAGLARDGQVPRRAKAALAAGGVYAFSPIDLVPGIIPVAGQLDDLFVVMKAVQYAVNASPPEVAAEHLVRAGLTREDVDTDMDAVRATIRWLIQRGAKTGGNLASAGLRKARALWDARS